jgi:hypothetical protein
MSRTSAGRILGLAGFAAAWLGTGCDDTLFGESEGEATLDPSIQGYSGVQQIAEDNCYGCHSATAAPVAGFGLDLETDLYAATVGVAGAYGVPLVVAGSSGESMLYLKVAAENPDGTGGSMPPGARMPDAVIDVIGAWIDDGATTE